uniref:BY PROTMAP: gi/472581865/gb/EMS19580.1/ glutamate carboxypeptidase II [Rhodosporidium toruloides NP11] gi/647402604/emb/CDR48837.1/ RHTO0S20e02454g1_1 [Rhodosporidium toruloides] n=1 Tax=Rhodotorula toruloides TaxID=5286 RepID=A0A0K3CQJ1_RHOTO
MTEKKSLADLAASKEPLLPLQTPSSSSPPRQTRTSLLKVIVALCALGSLWYQFGIATSTDGLARGGDWRSLARFGRHGCSHGGKGRLAWKATRLSEKDTQDTLLTVPSAESAKNASRAYTAHTHVAGTPEDRNVALLIKSQWEEILGADADPENKRVFDAGTDASREALLGRSKHGRHDDKKHKKHKKGLVLKIRRWMEKIARRARYGHHHGKKGHDHKGRHEPRLERPRVWTDTYYSLLNYPVSASLSITPPGASEPSWRAKLKEEVFKEDPTSGEGPGIWHGFSKNGTAKGQLVYASRGTKEDFELLKSKGVNVEGKIVAVQYGGSFRGLKVKAAAEAGAVGVVIFTDPIEDGEVTASAGHAAYPAGPARAPSSVQRGSVQYLSLYPGDPLTPGQPSYNPDLPNAPDRLDRDDPSVNVPTIPSLPLSYEDAIPLLKSLNGKGFKLEDGREGKPEGWREGALREYGVEYFTGPGEDEIELVNNVDDKITPIWNTYALIPGHIKDEVVVIGNHHDAWTFGAGDPNSGTSSMHETVRAFGSLLEKGWKPLRTILVAAWDAEEYGLIGSTEFGEDFAPWLKKNVVAYLNVDVSVSGPIFELNASPSFADLLRNVSAQVSDPSREGKTLADVWEGGDDEEEVTDEDSEKKLLPIAALGSGSDFTVFLQRLGIASANFAMRRSKKSPGAFHWQSTFGDPTYQRHIAVSKVLGLAAVRLVDDLVLPINVTAYAVELGRYVDKVASLPLASSLDFTRLRSLTSAILLTSQRIEQKGTKVAHAVEEKGDKRAIRQLRAVNKAIKAFETGFLGDEQGLKGREWYRHLGVAPGRWLGYGATTLPGLAEALTLDQDVEQAKVEIKRLEKAFATILKGLVKGVKA